MATPANLTTAHDDAELARLVDAGVSPIGLAGGDLRRTVGTGAPGAESQLVTVDVLRVRLDGRELIATAHVVARRPGPSGWWRGPLTAVMNADHLGDWLVAPRAHPNDGRLDVVDVDAAMSVRDRLAARRRVTTGDHVPHPAIRTRRAEEVDRRFDRPMAVWVDGVRVGRRVRELAVRVEADAYELHL